MIDPTHIHPMLVHFPIVFFLTAVAIQLVTQVRKENLAGRQCLATTGLALLVAGAVMAALAAGFGDIALDTALDKGFQEKPLEEHEDLGIITTAWFGVLALIQLFAWWRRLPLTGARGWVFVTLGVVGSLILISTAYHGGELVYELGVNVAAVKP